MNAAEQRLLLAVASLDHASRACDCPDDDGRVFCLSCDHVRHAAYDCGEPKEANDAKH